MPQSRPHVRALTALLAALAVSALAPSTSAAAGPALSTSRTHVLRVRPRIGRGLEADIPRTSAYARGIALDAQERFDESAARYEEAVFELGRIKTPPPGGAAVLEAWKHKARWQSIWSRQLGLRRRGYRPWGGTANGDLGQGYYMKFLAVRAYTGQAPLGLAYRARSYLESALRDEPGNVYVRLTLATLLHELGDPEQARKEYALAALDARQRTDPNVALRLAAYHVAAGDFDRAFVYLERALAHPYLRSSIRTMTDTSNEFDRLRDDPRFQQLLGPPAGSIRFFP